MTDRDPIPTVPETPKDIFALADKIAKSGTYDFDVPRVLGHVFYGRAKVKGRPNVPVVISSHAWRDNLSRKHEVLVKGKGGYFAKINHWGEDSENYWPDGRLPEDLGEMLVTVKRDEKGFDAHRNKAERERAEDDRVDARRRRRGLFPRDF